MDGGTPTGPGTQELTWTHVGLASTFIILQAFASKVLHLNLGNVTVIAAVRCVLQLVLVALILQKVFESNDPWAAAAIAFLLNLLGTCEAVITKSKLRFRWMFSSVFFSMAVSSVPLTIIGVRYCMSTVPFWRPYQFIPIMGMLCGNNITSIVVAVNHILREFHENRDKVEMHLAFGATRYEACRPIAIEALRVALMPMINAMSVIGIISIPGTMSGAILGGSSVEQAARLQMIIMFLLTSSMAVSGIVITVIVMSVVIDSEHRTRPDRIDSSLHAVWRGQRWLFDITFGRLVGLWQRVASRWSKRRVHCTEAERERLLG